MKLFVIPIAIALMSSGIASAKSRPIKDPSTPEARNTLAEATSCIVSASPDKSSSLLRMDFRTPAYKGKMQRLFDNNRNCFKEGWLRAHGLLVAGGLAEQLLAKSPQKTNVRLAMLAPNSTQRPRTPNRRCGNVHRAQRPRWCWTPVFVQGRKRGRNLSRSGDGVGNEPVQSDEYQNLRVASWPACDACYRNLSSAGRTGRLIHA